MSDGDAPLGAIWREPSELDRLARSGGLDIPTPGSGKTRSRFETLLEWGRRDLTMARLVEAHADAVAICAEAGTQPPAGLLGVWASEGPTSTLRARREGGAWLLNGTKQYCSGSRWVTNALVTAHTEDGGGLFVLPVTQRGISFDTSAWQATAFAGTTTATMRLFDVALPTGALVGPPGFYLERPGFWHGAVGVAACWAGGAIGLLDQHRDSVGHDPHADAHLGAMEAVSWAMRAVIASAAEEIDAHPTDRAAGEVRALAVRHVVEDLCQDVLRRFGRAAGPGPLAFDADCGRRVAELGLYVRQSHAERDLERLGALLRGGRSGSVVTRPSADR